MPIHHPPELMLIGFILTDVLPAATIACLCLMIWFSMRKVEIGYYIIFVALFAGPFFYAKAVEIYIPSESHGQSVFGVLEFCKYVFATAIMYALINLAIIIASFIIYTDRRLRALAPFDKIGGTIAVTALGIVQCALNYEVFVLRSS